MGFLNLYIEIVIDTCLSNCLVINTVFVIDFMATTQHGLCVCIYEYEYIHKYVYIYIHFLVLYTERV